MLDIICRNWRALGESNPSFQIENLSPMAGTCRFGAKIDTHPKPAKSMAYLVIDTHESGVGRAAI